MKFEIEISDAAFELLKEIEKNGYAEYRDREYPTIEDFKNSEEYKNGTRDVEWFKGRNFGGTYYLIHELTRYNLVDNNYEAWHLTFETTDIGKELIGQKYEFIFSYKNEKIKLGEDYFTVDQYANLEKKTLTEMVKMENSIRYFRDEYSAKMFIEGNTFISEDGEKYFYGIYMLDKKIYCVDQGFEGVDVHDGYYPGMSEHYIKYFHSKERAEEFLIRNKPCLCLNDVLPLIGDHLEGALLSIVNKKIKNND